MSPDVALRAGLPQTRRRTQRRLPAVACRYPSAGIQLNGCGRYAYSSLSSMRFMVLPLASNLKQFEQFLTVWQPAEGTSRTHPGEGPAGSPDGALTIARIACMMLAVPAIMEER